MMDVDGDLSVCNQCGFPLYDAVMASHTKYSCCSADINNFDFWRLNTSPGMVCLSNEKPAFYFERDKKFFDPGGCMAENHSPTRKQKQTSMKYGECKEEPCGTQLSTKENRVNERDNSESEGAVTVNANAILSKEKPKDVSSNEDRELQVDEGLQIPSTNRKILNEERQNFEDPSSSQSSCISDEVSQTVSPVKCLHSASELSCCEILSREIEDLKERVTQNEDFRRGVFEEVRDQRKFVQSHLNDISRLRIEIRTMQQDLVDLRNEHNRLNDEVKHLLSQDDSFRIRHDLINLITRMQGTQSKMQILENRSQSLETMVGQLAGEIQKLFVPYGPDVVQSTP